MQEDAPRINVTSYAFDFEESKTGKMHKMHLDVMSFNNVDFHVFGENGTKKIKADIPKQSFDVNTPKDLIIEWFSKRACGKFKLESWVDPHCLNVRSILFGKKSGDDHCNDLFKDTWQGKRTSAFLSVAFLVAKANEVNRIKLVDDASVTSDQDIPEDTRHHTHGRLYPVHYSAKRALLEEPKFYERWEFEYPMKLDEETKTKLKTLGEKYKELKMAPQDHRIEMATLVKEWKEEVEEVDYNWTAVLDIERFQTQKAWKEACKAKSAWMPKTTVETTYDIELFAPRRKRQSSPAREPRRSPRLAKDKAPAATAASFTQPITKHSLSTPKVTMLHSCDSLGMPSLHLLRIHKTF